MSHASPVTCHVLNTLSGTPAANIPATLTLLAPTPTNPQSTSASTTPVSFSAQTDTDGRVKQWAPSITSSSSQSVQDLLAGFGQGEKVPFSIKFEIGPWYEAQGVDCFWPEIEVKFYVRKGERHYHVPVLVGPWMYSTYRGS